jgi:hypothetical protein
MRYLHMMRDLAQRLRIEVKRHNHVSLLRIE